MQFFFFFVITIVSISLRLTDCQSISSCSCQFDALTLTMICDNVQSISDYHRCLYEQLVSQSEVKFRRGNLIRNLTIRYHQLENLSNNLLQFSYGNQFYQMNDLRSLSIVHGTLKQIENQSFQLIERTLEYLDLSNNTLQQIPKIFPEDEQSNHVT